MKKILTGIITLTCAVCFLGNSDASAGTAVNVMPDKYLVQDTNPMQRRDSTKWNKKRYKDSTGRPKRDTLPLRK